jgi:diguanylate cyclase (GGDEF)-like protein
LSEPPLKPSIADDVQADKLKLLYRQSFQAVFISIVVALLYTGIVWSDINRTALIIWLSAIFISTVFRLVLFLTYRRIKPQKPSILKWELPYYTTLIFSSLVWGLGAVLITYNEAFVYQVITFYFLMGMAGGALAVYSSIRYFAISTLAALLIPSSLWFFAQQNQTTLLMAVAATIFFLSAIRSTKILINTLHRTFNLSHELSLARDTAERLARTDALTELNNRRAFTELSEVQIQYCNRYQQPISLLLLDVDYFKKINDQFGHASGDAALQQLSMILKKTVRSSDICGRIGGEEFAILLPHTDLIEATVVAEKIRLSIETTHISFSERDFSMTVSIGVATDIYDLELLLKAADQAMYSAKQAGRNQVR